MTDRSGIRRALEPSSVAIVGASHDKSKRGYRILESIDKWGYEGDVYPVNPNYEGEYIRDYKVYARVSDIPSTLDLACIVTPAPTVPDILEDCGSVDTASAIVISAGFSEVGKSDLEARMLSVADEHNIRLIGPNANGLINVHHNLDLLGRPEIPRGNIAMVSQSGNLASGFVNEALQTDIGGFSFYISVGNEADVTFDEYLADLLTHNKTGVAMCYIEGLSQGRSFLQEARKFASDKPIAALKGGISAAGKQSAESHTASIAGSGAVVDDVYQQAGIVRVERADELLAVSDALASLPPAPGSNIGILSDGGGHATHAADTLAEHGLKTPKFTSDTQTRIREQIPDQAPNVVNPVDVLTLEHDMEIYLDCADAILEDPNIDGLLLCGYFGGYAMDWDGGEDMRETRVAEQIADLVDVHNKPIIAQSMYAKYDTPAIEALTDSPVPVFESINTATRCLDALKTYGRHLQTSDKKSDFIVNRPQDSAQIIHEALTKNQTQLSEYEAKSLLDEYGASVTPFKQATTEAEALDAATEFDGPIAMKILSKDIHHKSEIGGVALDIEGTGNVRSTYNELLSSAHASAPDAAIGGVLISPMVDKDGIEVIAGITRDEEVGQVVMFGIGGIFVEILEDVSFRAIPLTEFDAQQMINDIDANAIFDGARGRSEVDQEALVDLLMTLSNIACENPQITELDVNPAIVSSTGIEIIDAAVVLE